MLFALSNNFSTINRALVGVLMSQVTFALSASLLAELNCLAKESQNYAKRKSKVTSTL